jgi:hypothetical protein
MRTLTRRPLLTLALVALVATPVASGAQERIDRGYPLGAKGSVKIFNFAGSISVIGWERDSVSVTGTLHYGARFFGGGGRDGIKLGVESGISTKSVGGDLVVRVPATSLVWVRGAQTGVSVEGVIGSVDVGTVSGRVRVSGAPSELIVETMDGALDIEGSPGILRAKTAAGALTWRGAGTEAALSSVSGRISAEGGPLGRARIETISGDISVLAALRGDAMLTIESHSGSVELRLPKGVPTRVTADVSTLSGPGIKPAAAVASPKRAAPRKLDFNGAGDGEAAEVTVRSFKGGLRIVP